LEANQPTTKIKPIEMAGCPAMTMIVSKNAKNEIAK
jgi:hypothetical protein